MKILTWNIGSFFFLKYAKYFGITYKGRRILHEYFQAHLNGYFISNYIKDINPDILFLQEFYLESDVEHIEILRNYPYKKLISTWYHKHSILVASKFEFTTEEKGYFTILNTKEMNMVPIHLNSFQALKRLNDILILDKITESLSNVLVLGDTNIWSRGTNFLFKNDRKAYDTITGKLNDFTKDIISTSYIGFGLDKAFGSKSLKVWKTESPKARSHFMDHYPVILELDQQ
jgi:endonuclease/exonuclease/phosphatase family metal-dependent hydrolase